MTATAAANVRVPAWRLLLLLPLPLLAWAGWRYGLAKDIAPGFAGLLAAWGLFLAVLAIVAHGLQRRGDRRAAWLPWLAILPAVVGVAVFAGPATLLAGILLALVALAVGSLLAGLASPGIAIAAGLALIAAVVGWVLPFPIHFRWLYLALALLVLAWRWRATLALARAGAAALHADAVRHPGWMLLAVGAGGVASLGLWLPSLNYDDNAVHLILQAQLLADGRYRMDVQSQSWALAPWANNVLHAVAAMLAGGEARAAMGMLWLLLGMDGARRLALALDAKPAAAVAAAAVFAAQPFTGYFATTMQVDGASAALLLQLAAIAVSAPASRPGALAIGAIGGLLLSLKTINLLFALPLLAWIGWSMPAGGRLRWSLRMLALLLPLAASSYAYAAVVTGNPLFPFFNAWFQSPYYPSENFRDLKWMAGVGWRSPWDLTFASNVYGQYYPGAAGIAVLATLPALLVDALRRPRVRWLALWALACGVLLFLQMQYLRYLFPAYAVLAVLGVAALSRLAPWRGAIVALLLLVVLDALLMPTTSSYLRSNPWTGMVRDGPAAQAALVARIMPERTLLQTVMAGDPQACVLMTEPRRPFVGAGRGRALSMHLHYDRSLRDAHDAANADPTGSAWRQLLARIGPTHVILDPAREPLLARVLDAQGAGTVAREGGLQARDLAPGKTQPCDPGFLAARDQSRNLPGRDQGDAE